MSVIGILRDYFQGYPGWGAERLELNCLPREVDRCSIDAIPCEPIVKAYLDGSSVRQCQFTLSTRTYHGQDLQGQEANMAVFDGLAGWIEKKKFSRGLPQLGPGKKVRDVEITSTAYPYIVSPDGTARYQVQLRLTYLQEGKIHETE